MKTISFLPILGVLACAGCASTGLQARLNKTWNADPSPITVDALAAMDAAKPLRAGKIRVTFENIPAQGEVRAVPLDVKPGQQAMVDLIREFRYPSAFELPKANAKTGSVTPTAPTEFEVRNIGMTISFTPTVSGPFVILQGKVMEIVFEGFTQNPGAPFHVITVKDGTVVSPNRVQSPMFTIRETPFYAALQPGKPETFFVNTEHGPQKLTVSCAVIR